MFQVRTVAALAAATLVLTGAPGAAMAAPPVVRYQMVDLGALGGASSYAVASNDRGAVTGRSQVSDDDLARFPLAARHDGRSGCTFWPTDINNSGQILVPATTPPVRGCGPRDGSHRAGISAPPKQSTSRVTSGVNAGGGRGSTGPPYGLAGERECVG